MHKLRNFIVFTLFLNLMLITSAQAKEKTYRGSAVKFSLEARPACKVAMEKYAEERQSIIDEGYILSTVGEEKTTTFGEWEFCEIKMTFKKPSRFG